MRLLAALLLCPILFVLSGCATGGVRTPTKQSLTVDILQPTEKALEAFKELEINLFRGGTIPQLTTQTHRQIEDKMAIAFRSVAVAARAVRTWQPGQPVPVDVRQIMADVQSVHELLGTIGLSPTSLLTQQSLQTFNAASKLIAQFGSH